PVVDQRARHEVPPRQRRRVVLGRVGLHHPHRLERLLRLLAVVFYVEHDRQQAEEALEAMGMVQADAPEDDSAPLTRRYFVTGPLVYDRSAIERDIANFKRALEGVDVAGAFLPVVAPASAYWLENEHYATEEEFVFALADALHEEYRAIVDAGLLLQVDDAVLVHEYDSILSLGGSV